DQLLSILLAFRTTTHDVLVAGFLRAACTAFLLTAGVGRMTSTRCATFTTTVWVMHRVHCGSTGLRPNAFVAHTSCFTPGDVDLFGIADFTNSCTATNIHVTDFTGGKTKLCVFAFPSNQLNRCAS